MQHTRLAPKTPQQIHHGICPAAYSYALQQTLKNDPPPLALVVVETPRLAQRLASELDSLYHQESSPPHILVLPSPLEDHSDAHKQFNYQCDRLQALQQLLASKQQHTIALLTTETLFSPTPLAADLQKQQITWHRQQEIDFAQLVQDLTHTFGYDQETLCEEPGQFAVRGGLIDIYPIQADQPYRLDFFGDTLDQIHSFDPTSQRSLENVPQITLLPQKTAQPEDEGYHLHSFLPAQTHFIFIELAQQIHSQPNPWHQSKLPSTGQDLAHILHHRQGQSDHWLSIQELDTQPALFTQAQQIDWQSQALAESSQSLKDNVLGAERTQAIINRRQDFLHQLLAQQQAGTAVHIMLPEAADRQRLAEIISEDTRLNDLQIHYTPGQLRQGFRLQAPSHAKTTLIATEAELFGRHRSVTPAPSKKLLVSKAPINQMLDFAELAEGDYLVHQQNGICIFRGLTQLATSQKNIEVISLEFAGKLTLHVPLHESHLLTRYVGLAKTRPKLGKLSSNSWNKATSEASESALEFAAELLRLQAARAVSQGHAFPTDAPWQQAFADSFAFDPTVDQKRAILDTQQDMENEQPMDRLICGDVGFGKTEVALRAAFKAAVSGKQVAFLAPTTVLTQQHLNTFRQRMAEYPISIEMLSRFRSPKQQKEILAQVAQGTIDILIGTHRLLSQDIHYHDLGLLIIDEEHRFGVKHKEKIKRIKTHVDVLTLSATPIPRTLYSALVGLRDLSVIETPPRQRLPIETMVRSWDPQLVRQAIEFEIKRGGQAFYLHNRVQTIQQVAQDIQALLPQIRIGVGHGQMAESELEKVMTEYVAGHYDLLICTTIIESGLDIPNCNTILIENADRFGLAQLYQLRGRVGRFNRQAYAYLLINRGQPVPDQARKRLGTMQQYNQLGSGYRIALRDLELRGAGNLLGEAQSGHIASVGFDLYCELLRQSIAKLKGDPQASPSRCTLQIDFVITGENSSAHKSTQQLEAHIPKDYIHESKLRIDFYRKTALASTLDELSNIQEELQDRFGALPQALLALLTLHQIRIHAENCQFSNVTTENNKIKCQLAPHHRQAKEKKFAMIGNRFPRLTKTSPNAKLKEIISFLKRNHIQ